MGVVICAAFDTGIFHRDNYEINLGMQAGTLLYNWEVRHPCFRTGGRVRHACVSSLHGLPNLMRATM